MAEYFPDSPYVVDNVGSFSEELMLLLSTSATKNYNPGEIIYLQGEPSKYFYFLPDFIAINLILHTLQYYTRKVML